MLYNFIEREFEIFIDERVSNNEPVYTWGITDWSIEFAGEEWTSEMVGLTLDNSSNNWEDSLYDPSYEGAAVIGYADHYSVLRKISRLFFLPNNILLNQPIKSPHYLSL